MTFPQITLDDVLKVIQIIFYLIGAAVAILTYRSAKRGLLNTVNTEYQKRVMDRLKDLSDELASEFDPDSPNYWVNTLSVKDPVKWINNVFTTNKDAILKQGEFHAGIPETEDHKRVSKLVMRVKTDPFIPKRIRTLVTESLEKRAATLFHIYLDELGKYAGELANGKYTSSDELEVNEGRVHNRIVARLYESGCGISQIEEEVNKIRLIIQDYFESFNPLTRS